MSFLFDFFDTTGYMPHGVCLFWRPDVFWLQVVADGITALAYYSIPLALIVFVLRRHDLVFSSMFYMFGLFILACGTTHVMAIWVLWNPDYGVEGVVKAVTAVASIITAVILWQIMPRALALPSTAQLEGMNRELQREVGEREQAEAAVRQLNDELERRVEARTAELTEANARLTAEIAERERMAETLRDTHERLEALVQSSPLAIVSVDSAGRVISWNRSAVRTFGYQAEEVLNQPLPLMPEEGRATFEALFHRVAAAEILQDVEVACAHRNGRRLDVRLSGAPLLDSGGNLRGAVYTLEDVTDSTAIRRQLNHAQRMEAVGQLSGGMAHDFNNLLTVVIGNLDLLQSELTDLPDAQDAAETALDAALRGAELTRQLLAFSRRQSLAATPIDLNALVLGTTGMLDRMLGEQVEIVLKLADGLWPALTDPTQVESALTNLAINARDAMPQGGNLTIETGNIHLDAHYAAENADVAPGDYVMLAVSDTGTGIPRDVLDQVFDPFFTTKDAGKGSGLGLSMIYGFAKQSQGHVKIYSEEGHGTIVRLYLPRTTASARPTANADAAGAAEAAEGGAAILVVEDRDDVRQVVVKQLRSFGYQVAEAADGAQALAMLAGTEPVDLLFTDVVMPGGMSGVELAEKAQAIRPGLKVLFTSGFTEAALANGSRPNQIGQMLAKPYRIQDLARKVHEVLHGTEA